MEDYAKEIYRLQQTSQGGVATNDLAAAMSVAPSSATAMVKALAKLGIAEHTPYQGVRLTPAGERLALEVIRHHRLIERYLQEFLGFRWDEVHEEADRLEHAISERLEERLANLLGNPETDPHGDPIPARDGSLPPQSLIPVLSLSLDEPATIRRVLTSDPEKLRYLAELGLVPGAKVTLRMAAPFGGPIFLRVNDVERSIGPELAMDILVSPDGMLTSEPERTQKKNGHAAE
jgi:DtxR family Mn-dependent transcriptional regulator